MKSSSDVMVVPDEKSSLTLYRNPLLELDNPTRLAQDRLMHLASSVAQYERDAWFLQANPTATIRALLINKSKPSTKRLKRRKDTLTALQQQVEFFCQRHEVNEFHDLIEDIKTGKKQGLDPENRDREGSTLLHFAVMARDDLLVKNLLALNCSPLVVNENGDSPISLAMKLGRRNKIQGRLLRHIGDNLVKSSLNRINTSLVSEDELIKKWATVVSDILETVNKYGKLQQHYSGWNGFFRFFSGYMFEEQRAQDLLIKLYSAVHEHGNDLDLAELQLVIKECIDEAGFGIFSSKLKSELVLREAELKSEGDFKKELVLRKNDLLHSQVAVTQGKVLELTEQVELLRKRDESKAAAVLHMGETVSKLKEQISEKAKETESFKAQLESSMQEKLKGVDAEYKERISRLEKENQGLALKLEAIEDQPAASPMFMPGFENFKDEGKSDERIEALEEKNHHLESEVEKLTKDLKRLLTIMNSRQAPTASAPSEKTPEDEQKSRDVVSVNPFG